MKWKELSPIEMIKDIKNFDWKGNLPFIKVVAFLILYSYLVAFLIILKRWWSSLMAIFLLIWGVWVIGKMIEEEW